MAWSNKGTNNYEEILSILAIFKTKSADIQGKNPRITNFVHKMITADKQNREYQDREWQGPPVMHKIVQNSWHWSTLAIFSTRLLLRISEAKIL